jgi:hypothetical protein
MQSDCWQVCDGRSTAAIATTLVPELMTRERAQPVLELLGPDNSLLLRHTDLEYHATPPYALRLNQIILLYSTCAHSHASKHCHSHNMTLECRLSAACNSTR